MNIPFILAGLQKTGLTQSKIGAELGVAQATVSSLLNGKDGVKRPSAKVEKGLRRLAKKFSVPVEPPP